MNQSVQNNVEKAGQDLRQAFQQLVKYYLEFGLSEDRALRSALADFAAEVPARVRLPRGG